MRALDARSHRDLLTAGSARLTGSADTHPHGRRGNAAADDVPVIDALGHDEPPLTNATKPIRGRLGARAVCQANTLLQQAILDHRDKRWMQDPRGVALHARGRAKLSGIDPFAGSVAPPPPSAKRAFRTRVRDQRLAAGGSSRVLRLSSLWNICSAMLASADQFSHAN